LKELSELGLLDFYGFPIGVGSRFVSFWVSNFWVCGRLSGVFVVILVALLLFGVVVVVVVVVCGVGVVSPRTRQPISHSRPSKCRAGECSSSGTKTI